METSKETKRKLIWSQKLGSINSNRETEREVSLSVLDDTRKFSIIGKKIKEIYIRDDARYFILEFEDGLGLEVFARQGENKPGIFPLKGDDWKEFVVS